jgi:tRNA pseudouridine13 synthase
MALREVTKIDTSSHVQTSLTSASEDQSYRGVGKADKGTPVEDVEMEENVEMEAVGMEMWNEDPRSN